MHTEPTDQDARHLGWQIPLLTRAEFHQLGWSQREIRDRAVRVWRGCFVSLVEWRRLSPPARHIAQCRAAAQQARGPFAFSHGTAAILHGLPLLPVPERVNVMLPNAPQKGFSGAQIHRSVWDRQPELINSVLPVVPLAETVVDCAHARRLATALTVADAALRQAASLHPHDPDGAADTLHRHTRTLLREKPHRPGCGVAKVALAEASRLASAPAESAARAAIMVAGLPRPVLHCRPGPGWDFPLAYPSSRVGIEILTDTETPSEEAFAAAKAHELALANAGWRAVRTHPAELYVNPRAFVTRLHGALLSARAAIT